MDLDAQDLIRATAGHGAANAWFPFSPRRTLCSLVLLSLDPHTDSIAVFSVHTFDKYPAVYYIRPSSKGIYIIRSILKCSVLASVCLASLLDSRVTSGKRFGFRGPTVKCVSFQLELLTNHLKDLTPTPTPSQPQHRASIRQVQHLLTKQTTQSPGKSMGNLALWRIFNRTETEV